MSKSHQDNAKIEDKQTYCQRSHLWFYNLRDFNNVLGLFCTKHQQRHSIEFNSLKDKRQTFLRRLIYFF